MPALYVYSTYCEIKDGNKAVREEKRKVYTSLSKEGGKILEAQAEIPEYEDIKGTSVYQLFYPKEIYSMWGSLQAISLLFKDCHRCQLCLFRKTYVHCRGAEGARVCFVGMAPGDVEDEKGEPFVGPSGRLLEYALRDSGFSNPGAIFNLVGCRPNDGLGAVQRDDPKIEEMVACSDRLWLMLNLLKPNFVIALGRQSATMFWEKPEGFDRNRLYEAIPGKVWVAQMYHPSYLLRVAKSGSTREHEEFVKFLTELDKNMAMVAPFPRQEEWHCNLDGGEYPFAFINASLMKKKAKKRKKAESDPTPSEPTGTQEPPPEVETAPPGMRKSDLPF